MATGSKREKLGSMRGVVTLLSRNKSEKYQSLDTNPANAIVYEVVDKDVTVRFRGTVESFSLVDSPMCRNLSALLTKEELRSLASESCPEAPDAYVLDAKVLSSRCNIPNQDFRLAASFTKGCLQYVEYVSPGSLSSEIRHLVNETKLPIYSVHLPASTGGDEISNAFGDTPMVYPAPLPIIQGGSNVWHDSIKMYAGVNKGSIDNTIKKGNKVAGTRADSLVGFVVKSMCSSATFVHEGNELPINADVIIEAPISFFTEATNCISDRVQSLAKFGKVSVSAIQFQLLSDTLSQDYERDNVHHCLTHKTTGSRIYLDHEVEVDVVVNFKFVYPVRKANSTAMSFDTAQIWFHDVWNEKLVEKQTGRVKKDAVPFTGTIAEQERKEMAERKAREEEKRFEESRQAKRQIDRDLDYHLRYQGEEVENIHCHSPSSSSSSSSSSSTAPEAFYNPLLTDD
jgi:hypothetical protein